MGPLYKLLDKLETKIPLLDQHDPTVSAGSVAWHVEHIILSATKMANATLHSDPSTYRWQFNWRRLMVFTTGRIPRGKAKAPAAVVPGTASDARALAVQLIKLRNKLDLLKTLKPHHYFEHPYFGALHVKHTQRAIYIHTQHHLAIIEDIVGKTHNAMPDKP